MRYLVLACDFDGTLASDGKVRVETLAALQRLRDSGRKLILATGREHKDLLEAPRADFVEALRARKVSPLSVGHSLVATWQPNEGVVLDTIRDLGLELQVIFNKGAVM